MAATLAHGIHVPCVAEQDEYGVWCACAQGSGVGAAGEGPTREAVIADLRSGLGLLIEEVGVPAVLTITFSLA